MCAKKRQLQDLFCRYLFCEVAYLITDQIPVHCLVLPDHLIDIRLNCLVTIIVGTKVCLLQRRNII